MFTCKECAEKLNKEGRLEDYLLILFKDIKNISFGTCEFCEKSNKETIDFHHSLIKPME